MEEKLRVKLPRQDLELLYQLCKFRALSTAQMAKVGDLGKWYVYKKLGYLKDLGYLYSEQITGNYIPNQKRQGSYYRISGKGITLLKANGYLVDSTADDLKVTKYRLAYLLTGNELALALGEVGWKFKDSREIKRQYDINRGDILQGGLTNPNNDKEYALYIFFKKVSGSTLAKLKGEISRIPIENVLITTRGESSFHSIMKSFVCNKDKVIKGGSIKVLPFGFAKTYLTLSSDNEHKHKSFLKELGLDILDSCSNKNLFESKVRFDYVVKHNGEEKYFVDLLDNDLMKIYDIKSYRREDFERDGRKMLVLTSTANFHMYYHKQMLGDIQHIEYITMDLKKVVDYSKKV